MARDKTKTKVDQIVEEVGIVVNTGICPRCGCQVDYTISEDQEDIEFRCPNCNTWWGASAGMAAQLLLM